MFVFSVSTPDGASELLEDVDSRLQQHGNSSLVQGTPVYGPRTLQRSMDKTRLLHNTDIINIRFMYLKKSCRLQNALLFSLLVDSN